MRLDCEGVAHSPGDGLDDAVQLVSGGGVAPPHGEHQVDGIEEAGEGLGEVGRLKLLQGVLQSLLWAAHTPQGMQQHTHLLHEEQIH